MSENSKGPGHSAVGSKGDGEPKGAFDAKNEPLSDYLRPQDDAIKKCLDELELALSELCDEAGVERSSGPEMPAQPTKPVEVSLSPASKPAMTVELSPSLASKPAMTVELSSSPAPQPAMTVELSPSPASKPAVTVEPSPTPASQQQPKKPTPDPGGPATANGSASNGQASAGKKSPNSSAANASVSEGKTQTRAQTAHTSHPMGARTIEDDRGPIKARVRPEARTVETVSSTSGSALLTSTPA